jgi:hypothetical protein
LTFFDEETEADEGLSARNSGLFPFTLVRLPKKENDFRVPPPIHSEEEDEFLARFLSIGLIGAEVLVDGGIWTDEELLDKSSTWVTIKSASTLYQRDDY